MTARLMLGLAAASFVSLAGNRARSLSAGGAVAATTLGTAAVAAGWDWGALLIVFFLTTSALSRFRAAEKKSLTGDMIEKGERRDAEQVLANGGTFGMAAVAFIATSDPVWLAAGGGALAAAAADSWATEIGILSRAAPRLIGSNRRVAPGTSGGVTVAGIFGALSGAATMGLTVTLLGWPKAAGGAAFIAGVAGMFFDSFLGATMQARRLCPRCARETEREVHGCGTRTDHVRGMRWVDNDAVNLLTTVFGGVLGATMFHALG